MAIDYDNLINWKIADVHHAYSDRDTILYSLGLGIGTDPHAPNQLRHVYEKNLVPFPSMAVTLATGGSWSRDPGTGITYAQVLHAEQHFEIFRSFPAHGTVVSKSRVIDIVDKGHGRGAIVTAERLLYFNEEVTPSVRLESSLFCRADGGFGGPAKPGVKPHRLPERDKDVELRVATLPQAALIYRLSGDYNELHVDPDVAAKAGFSVPILHGLCSFGMALRSIVEGLDIDPADMRGAGVRFTSIVYPGETLTTDVWRDGNMISFRTHAAERSVVALNHGYVRIAR